MLLGAASDRSFRSSLWKNAWTDSTDLDTEREMGHSVPIVMTYPKDIRLR
jgi:hypothetical protein